MISIVIPNFNSGQLLAKNLPKLTSLLKKWKDSGRDRNDDYEIIISDDASTNDSVTILSNLSYLGSLGNPKLVTSPVNTGFGSCVDRGIKASRGEIVFILNITDILPQNPDYFSLMLKHFDDPKVFSVAAAKKDETGNHGRGIIIFFRGLYLHFHSHEDYGKWLLTMRTACHSGEFAVGETTPESILDPSTRLRVNPASPDLIGARMTSWADGGSQAIRKSSYDKIGGFDPHYFLYWEDVDLGFRAWKAGFKIVYEPKAILIHAKIEGPIAKRFSESEIRRLNIRNQIYFTWKNSDLWHKVQFLFWLPYHIAVAVKNRDGEWFGSLIPQFPKFLQS